MGDHCYVSQRVALNTKPSWRAFRSLDKRIVGSSPTGSLYCRFPRERWPLEAVVGAWLAAIVRQSRSHFRSAKLNHVICYLINIDSYYMAVGCIYFKFSGLWYAVNFFSFQLDREKILALEIFWCAERMRYYFWQKWCALYETSSMFCNLSHSSCLKHLKSNKILENATTKVRKIIE